MRAGFADGFAAATGFTINGATTMSAGRKVQGFHAYRVSHGVWGVVLLGAVVSGAWVSHAADDKPAAGLRGILPTEVPADLSATIGGLPPTWEDWGNALTADLTALYAGDALDVAGQRKAIAALDARLSTVSKSLADPRYKAITNQLVSLHGGLKRRLDVAKAALETLELGPEVKAARIEAARKEVARTSSSLKNYLSSIKGGDGWMKYLGLGQVDGDASRSAVTLASVQTKLKGKANLADAKVRDFMGRPEIVAYEQAVDAYLAANNAAAPSSDSAELRNALGELLKSLDSYELLADSTSAGGVRKAFEAVRTSAPDGGERIAQALRTNYFNYNLRVVATEAFLNRLASERRTENGGVVDFILGANVSGNQTTNTQVTIDLVPSATVAQFDIVANGAISSSTVGSTDQANIYTQGNHYFTASKRVLFNGDQFWTQPARISVNANNTTVGADTKFSGLPLFGRFADGIAMSRAEEMRGESEAIAASRVQDNVLPKFNGAVDSEFGANGKFNPDLGKRLATLHELQLFPDARAFSTTDSELKVSTRLMSAAELGGSDPNPALVLGRGATVLIHTSLMNNGADRLDIKGQTLTDDELAAKLEANLTKLLGREVKFKDDKPKDSEEAAKTLVFDKTDPIRFRATDGALLVTLRAGLKQEGKDEIPTQIITIPLQFSVDQKNVVIEPGNVSVSPVEKPDSAATQVARAGVIKKKIEVAFPRREIDRVKPVDHNGTKVLVAVTRIKATDGWLSITFE